MITYLYQLSAVKTILRLAATGMLLTPLVLCHFAQAQITTDRKKRLRLIEDQLYTERWRKNFDVKGHLKKLDNDGNGIVDTVEFNAARDANSFLREFGIEPTKAIKISVAVKQSKDFAINEKKRLRKRFSRLVGPELNRFGTEVPLLGVSSFESSKKPAPKVTSFEQRVTGLKESDFPKETLFEARKILNGYDRDKSGFLEGEEIRRIRWAPPFPFTNDLNSDGRLSLLELTKRLEDRYQAALKKKAQKESQSKGGNRSGRRNYSRGRTAVTTESPSQSKSTRSNAQQSRSAKNGDDKAFTSYVDGLFRKYDSDKDQRLSSKELKKMRRPFKGDTNNDGFISKPEAIAFIRSSKSQSTQNSRKQSASLGGPQQPVTSASNRGTPPGSAGPRNPLGKLDINADGQIQMSEFSSQWDEVTLTQFRDMDSDSDGIISAEEWTKKGK
jgi:Ca2+-binding EF-hand superfamily protein